MAIEWDAVRDEVVGHLQALLRLDTRNPPGNEAPAAAYIAGVLRAHDIPYDLVESKPERTNVVARLRGTGAGRPVLLLSHTDVVGVEREHWTHDPFGSDVAEGMVWGRGALDMKNYVAAHLTALLLLKREGLTLSRDIILAAVADEETSSAWGAHWLWQHRRDLIDAEYALCEVGGHLVEVNGQRFYTVQTGEKGPARLRLTARAAPGHGSVPRDDTAVARLARALVRLGEMRTPTVILPPVEAMLRRLGDAYGDLGTTMVEDLLRNPTAEALAALPLPEQTLLTLRATTRDTAVPTILSAGQQINVIPSESWAELDARLLPGHDAAAWAAEIGAAVGDEVEVTVVQSSAGAMAGAESPLLDAMAATMDAHDPGAGLLPYLMPGRTDATSIPGIMTYGFLPTRSGTEALGLIHGHDERVRIDDLLFGTRCLYEVLAHFCSQ